MNARRPFTTSSFRALTPGEIVWDTEVIGLHARKANSGAITLYMKQRIKGRQVKTTIGRFGSPWTIDTVRKEALRLRTDGYQGINENERRAEERQRGITVDVLCDVFLDKHGPRLKPRTRDSYAEMIRLHIKPRFGKLAAINLSGPLIAQAHDDYVKNPRRGNYMVAILSSVLNWGRKHGHLPPTFVNPCTAVDHFKEKAREVMLSPEQSQRLGEILRAPRQYRRHDFDYAIEALWVILFTGARKSEILNLQHSHIDREHQLLNLPDSKTGEKKLFLTREALERLLRIPKRADDPYVFPALFRDLKSRSLNHLWSKLRKKADLPSIRIHDLRHNYGSLAIETGTSTAALSKQFGHSTTRMTERYVHIADKHWRDSVDRTGQHLEKRFLPAAPRKPLRDRFRKKRRTIPTRSAQSTGSPIDPPPETQ